MKISTQRSIIADRLKKIKEEWVTAFVYHSLERQSNLEVMYNEVVNLAFLLEIISAKEAQSFIFDFKTFRELHYDSWSRS